jgi:hypothetical protein
MRVPFAYFQNRLERFFYWFFISAAFGWLFHLGRPERLALISPINSQPSTNHLSGMGSTFMQQLHKAETIGIDLSENFLILLHSDGNALP